MIILSFFLACFTFVAVIAIAALFPDPGQYILTTLFINIWYVCGSLVRETKRYKNDLPYCPVPPMPPVKPPRLSGYQPLPNPPLNPRSPRRD